MNFHAGKAFRKILRDVVTPLLTDNRYRKAGSVYRKVGPTGGVAIVSFHSKGAGKDICEFDVRAAVALGSDLELTATPDATDPNKATNADATLRLEVNPPPDRTWSTGLVDGATEVLAQLLRSSGDDLPPQLAHVSGIDKDKAIANGLSGLDKLADFPPLWWTIIDDQTATIAAGCLLTQLSVLAPYLSDLLDPAFFLEQTRLPDFPRTFPIDGVRYIGVGSADYLRLLVTADHDPDDEFTELVDAWESDTNWTIAAWLRARHAAHR